MIAVEHATQSVRLRPNVARPNIDKTYTARLAITRETRKDAYHLRHRSYVNSGFIGPQSGELLFDKYDSLPSSHTVVIYDGSRPVASVRVSFLSCDTLESAAAGAMFPEEAGRLLAGYPRYRNAQAAEICRLARSPECENNQGLVFLLLRAAGYLAIQENVSLLMSTVMQHHIPFYRRIGCHVASEPKFYPGQNDTPVRLLACPRANYDAARAAFPIMDPLAGPPDSFAGFMSGRAVAMPLFQPE